jgi:hypothetical protein
LPAFINSLDSNIQSIVKTVKIPHWDGFGNATDVLASGANGLSTKAFILSNMECYDEDTILESYYPTITDAIRGDGYMLDYCAFDLPFN